MRLFILSLLFLSFLRPAEATTILALGDSLTAGYGLDAGHAMPDILQAALRAKGLDVKIINAGVSGDTAAQGAARLDWALTPDVQAVIVELGANDALRGLPPAGVETALRAVLEKVKARNLPLLILGMKAPPNLGSDYVQSFDALYPALAKDYGALLDPFYLAGVAADPKLNQADMMHPNDAGVAIIVERLLPLIKDLVAKVK